MAEEQQVGAVQLSAQLHGVSLPVTRRLRIAEQVSLAELHAVLQVAFGWSDEHLCKDSASYWMPLNAPEPWGRALVNRGLLHVRADDLTIPNL
jgi:hypothetical protein